VTVSHRWRLGLAEGGAKYDNLEKRLAAGSASVPTITLKDDGNGAPHPEPSAYAKKFSGKYSHQTIKGGVGHNLPQEAPRAFADAIVEVDSYSRVELNVSIFNRSGSNHEHKNEGSTDKQSRWRLGTGRT